MTNLDFGDMDEDLQLLFGDDLAKEVKTEQNENHCLVTSDDSEAHENYLPSVDPPKQSIPKFECKPDFTERKRRGSTKKISYSSAHSRSSSPDYSTEDTEVTSKRRKKTGKASATKSHVRGRGRPKKRDVSLCLQSDAF